ncbi:MAG: 3D domain-containing protein [Vicinamibacterales bacterium]
MMKRRLISRFPGRQLAVTCIAVIGFVLLYEASMFDLRQRNPAGPVDPTLPVAGARLVFTATAYCKGTTTASGVGVRTGIAASDPVILPVGSVVNVSTHDTKYNGVYTIMDTGPAVQGRVLDLYMWSCHEALAFGRRPVELTVLRLGWNPSASTPSLVERLFRRREAARAAAPPAPTSTSGAGADERATEAALDGPSDTSRDPLHPASSDVSTAPATPTANVSVPPAVPIVPITNEP